MKRPNILAVALIAAMLLVAGAGQAAEKTPLTVKRIGEMVLDPPLLFPPGSQMRAIELVRGANGELNFGYLVLMRMSFHECYAFYRRAYSRARAKWHGLQQSGSDRLYVFAVYPANASKRRVHSFTIFERPVHSDVTAIGLTAQEARQSMIRVLVDAPPGLRMSWPDSMEHLVLPVPARPDR